MSTDKFKDVFTNPPTFVSGEQPKGTKFSQWAAKTDYGMDTLGRAVGNMWASFKINNDPYPLLIASLARAVGSMDYINPYIPAGIDVANHKQLTAVADTREMYLELFPDDGGVPSGSWLIDSNDQAVVIADWKASRAELAADGDWTYEGRVIYTYKAFGEKVIGRELEERALWYNGTTSDGDLGTGFGVIPNLSQMTGADNTACIVTALVDGGGETYYEVELPFLQTDKMLPGETGTPPEPVVGVNTVQLELPIQAQPPTTLTDEEIPPGLIWLWDVGSPFSLPDAAPIGDTAVYYAVDEHNFRIRNVTLDVDVGTPNNTRFFLVTMGTSLAEAVGQAWNRFRNHTHSVHEFGSVMAHGNLADLAFKPIAYDNSELLWVKAYNVAPIIKNNDHPQYVYREGHRPGAIGIGGDPGTYFNAMVGDLCLASVDETNRHSNIDDDSVKLLFHNELGARIYYHFALDRLLFQSISVDGGGTAGGFQFGVSGDQPYEMQARCLGVWDFDADINCNADANIFGTLFVDSGGDVDIDCNVDIDGTLDSHGAVHLYDTLEVDGAVTFNDTWDFIGTGRIRDDVAVDTDATIDGVDVGDHRHMEDAAGDEGNKIPVEGLNRDGRDTFTSVKINSLGYAVYAP